MREPDGKNRQMQLLRQEHLQFLHKEPEEEEDRPQDDLQGLLEQHRKEKHV
jgi:hypothetical protein